MGRFLSDLNMKIVFAFALFALIAMGAQGVPSCSSDPVPNSDGYCSCGASGDDLKLTSVSITPAGGTVQKGSPITPFASKTITVSETLPSEAPSGKYSGSAKATDQSGNEIACIDFAFTVQ